MPKVEREFEYNIYIRRNSDRTGGVGLGARTIAEMMTKVFYNACFYMSQTGAFVEVAEVCKRCGGKGDIPRGVRRPPAKCPMCKGVNASRVIIETIVKPSEACTLNRYDERIFTGEAVRAAGG